MNPAKTPNGGRPIAASAKQRQQDGEFAASARPSPLMACGSTSSPYRVRTTCQASRSPLVASADGTQQQTTA